MNLLQVLPFFTLDQAISSMENVQQWTYGILTLADGNDGASVLLCVKQGNYYIFDSHSRDSFGRIVPNGTSVLLHMKTHNALMKYIKSIGYQLGASQFEITVLSPAVSGFHCMLQPGQLSQSSQNQQNEEKVQENSYKSRTQSTCNSSKKYENKKQAQNVGNISSNIQQNDNSQRRSTRISNERQHNKRQTVTSNIENRKEKDSYKKRSTNKCNNEDDQKERAKKLNEIRKNKKEEKKNRDKERYETKKRKMSSSTDEELKLLEKRTKYENSQRENSSSNIEKRYNTRSKTSAKNANLQSMERNLSQSRKRKQKTDEMNDSSKDKNTVSNDNNNNRSKRRQNRQNEKYTQIESNNTSVQEVGIDDNQNREQEEQIDNHNESLQNKTINMDECLKLFNVKISNGPIYVCTVCLQMWFRRSVLNIEFIKVSSQAEEEKLNQCRRNYVSIEDKEWICKTCQDCIKSGRIPKFSVENKMGFPPQPKELKLNGMEECFTAPRLTLFQMRDLPCGGQKSVRGNSVNLPIDIAPTVEMLPRTLDNTETIAINYKCHLCYKGCAFKQENIRPAAVWKAVNYLMTHSQMYKDLDIQLDTSWIRNMETCDTGACECLQQNTENSSQPPDVLENNDEQNDEDIDNIEEDEDHRHSIVTVVCVSYPG